ncbi:Mitotic exit network component, partial [Ascosphaera pollenicola]
LGYTVVDRQPNSLTVRVQPNEDTVAIDETFEILNVIEFSSTRKRMSIIVRMPDGRVCVFTKGADTILLKLLKRSGLASEKMAAVNKRTSYRKSLEAKEAIRRNSMQIRGSIHRSMSLPRGSLARDSAGPSMRQSMDLWLREREHDPAEAVRGRSMSEEHYNSRPSAQLRRSLALQEARPSAQMDGIDEELVEETLVVSENQVFERCFQHLDDFATEGLRTLLYGYRYLDEVEYQKWREAYQEATTSLVDRQEKIERVGEEIETKLELLGATAIEDKLQKGVPEAIEKLRRANIKLWMLTGDKRETAINIGHSCHLVKDYSTLTILDYTSGNVDHTLVSTTQAIQKGGVAHSVVVVDGQTLSYFEENAVLSERFFDLAILVDSVICCRASPKQKAYLVSAIRKRVRKAITLAIGDGANDIAMIQEAHVGIGIAGKEGLQAARISDYSIAQFRFLLKLLLVHGRWNYVRVCKYTLGTFWKETLFYLTQALYQKWNGYTGTSMYEPWGLSMFNTLFTSLPVIFLGILEKDLNPATLLAVPELYSDGQRHKGFNVGIYLFWAFTAVCEAVMIYFIMFSLFGQAAIFDDNSIFPMGFMTFTAAVVLINLKLQGLVIHYKTYFAGLVNFISIGGWWLWNIFLNAKATSSTLPGPIFIGGLFSS